MTRDDWQRAKGLFHEALDRTPEERVDYLDRACGGDVELRRRVARLLKANDEADRFLTAPGLGPGDRIGPYALVEEIGAGGFGTVYRARQTEPVRRDVALKILKLGMDTEEILARFEAERQALARMSHPGIAQVHDAGTTEQGRPYFVMELVDGVPVTRYCDDAALDTEARLELFRQACMAIQHAHQKGVVHRDVKPSNVLVTEADGHPAVKVIDFGIAKAIGQKLTEKTFVTLADRMVGTPEYMSPEQAEMPALDVDTRADVYSLGALLYELLTSTPPLDARTGYLEYLQAVREKEPPRPSTRISTLGDRLEDAARRRRATPRNLGRLLRGELDWIAMKALEKDRARRYETAEALARDVERFLRDEPVEAGPPSVSYRVRKFVRRHRTGVVAAALVLVALLAGLAAATIGFMEARRKEREARIEARRAGTVVELVNRAFTAIDPHTPHGPSYTVHQLLLGFGRDLGASLEGEPEVEATLRLLMGRGFLTLGLLDDAERHASRAVELCRALYGEEDERTIDALVAWANVQHDRGDYKGSMRTHRRVLALRRASSPDDTAAIAAALNAVADLHRHAGDYEAAIETGEKSLALYRKLGSGTRGVPSFLPRIYRGARREDDALKLYRELVGTHRRLLGDGHPRTAPYLAGLATLLRDRREFGEAETLARDHLAIARRFAGPGSPLVAGSLVTLGTILTRAGKFAEAEPALVEAVATARAAGLDDDRMRDALLAMGDLCNSTKRYAEAERSFLECIEITARRHGEGHIDVAQTRAKLGKLYRRTGDYEAAEKVLREAIRALSGAYGSDHNDVLLPQVTLGRVLLATKRAPEAERILRPVVRKLRAFHPGKRRVLYAALNALAVAIGRQGRTPLEQVREAYEISVELWGENRSLRSRYAYGRALVDVGKPAEGERMLRGAYEGLARIDGPAHKMTLTALSALASCLGKQEKHAEAEPLLRELVDRERERNDLGGLADALARCGRCLTLLERHAEAEPVLVEHVELRERLHPPGDWRRYDAMLILGDCLAGAEEFERAERLFLEVHGAKPSPDLERFRRAAKKRLARLYEAWGRPDEAREWREKE